MAEFLQTKTLLQTTVSTFYMTYHNTHYPTLSVLSKVSKFRDWTTQLLNFDIFWGKFGRYRKTPSKWKLFGWLYGHQPAPPPSCPVLTVLLYTFTTVSLSSMQLQYVCGYSEHTVISKFPMWTFLHWMEAVCSAYSIHFTSSTWLLAGIHWC